MITKPPPAFAVDQHGFLVDPPAWGAEVAQEVAWREGIAQLTEDHWKIINFVRWYGTVHSSPPWIKDICRKTGTDVVTLWALFPQRPLELACKIAGLPWFPELDYLGCGADPVPEPGNPVGVMPLPEDDPQPEADSEEKAGAFHLRSCA